MDSAKQILTQLRGVWQRTSTGRRMLLVILLGGVIAALVWFSRGNSGGDYGVLYSGLTPADAGEVATELSARSIPYHLTSNGTAVEVPGSDVYKIRMELAAAGLPRGGGVGFEIFDTQKFGTSSFVEQVNYRRALQGELSRSIAALDAVDGARVHIAMGKRSVFRDSDEPPTASVALDLRGGRALSHDQVQGIIHLVSSSVDGLTPDRVTVIDGAGNVLSTEDDSGNGSQNELEAALTKRVSDLVEKVVGVGQAAVTVTAEIDSSKVDQTEELYDKDSSALRSEARIVEGNGDTGTVGGLAGARGNLPGAPPPTAAPATGGGGNNHLQETRNWEINRIVRRTVGPDTRIKRLQVAVLVNDAPAAEPGGKRVPRSKEQLDQISALARTAAGLDEQRGDKIEVRSVSWNEIAGPDEGEGEAAAAVPFWKNPMYQIGAGAGLVVLFMLFLLLRRKKQESPAMIGRPTKVAELEAALEAGTLPAGLSGMALQPAPADLHGRVLGNVKSDTPRAARILSAWLAEEEGAKASP